MKGYVSRAAVVWFISVAVVLFAAPGAYAATPTLSLTLVSGDSVQINVTGDPNSGVAFYYNVGSSSGANNVTLGTTNSSGAFSTTISSNSYAVNSGSSVYVVVNSQQSVTQVWPYGASGTSGGTPVLSQSGITVGLGQSMTVVSQGSGGVYVAFNSNSSVASFNANGTQVVVTGNQIGSTTMTICYVGTASNCASLSVTVQSATVQAPSFSQNNIYLTVGGSQSVAISGSGSYNVSSNSNPSVASSSLSGSTLTVTAIAVGVANITVCNQSAGGCSILYLTVGGSSVSGSLSFSQTSLSIVVGQVASVTVSGGNGYYVSGNTNSGVASQTLSGGTLSISGLANGATTITVCSAANGCGSVYVTVGSSSGTGQTVTFGTTNPTVMAGQGMNISLSGGSGYFVSSNPNTSVAQASVSGNTLALYGVNVGSDSITVCASSGGCGTVYVTVASAAAAAQTAQTASAGSLLAQIQSLQSELSQVLAQIQTMQSKLVQLTAQVAAMQGGGTAAQSGGYQFLNPLSLGSTGTDVTSLQKLLAAKGYYSGSITGYYGTLTMDAVMRYQTAHGITPLGNVGPATRAALNAE
jgi:hypothetical protein